MQTVGVRPHDIAIISLMAVVMALGITMVKPTVGLYVALGLLVLLLALASTRAALYLLIFSMLLSPEIGLGQVQGYGVGGRQITFRMDDVLLIIIGFSWLAKTIIYRELALIKSNPLTRPILYYMVACIAATFVGILMGRVLPTTAFFYLLKYFEYFFIFFMVVNIVTSKDQAVYLIIALLVTCFLICVYALSQIPTGLRVTAPFEGEIGEPNTLGGYLVFIMAITTGLLLHVQGVSMRALLVGLLGLSVLALMATLSRASYVAAGALVMAVGVTQWRRPGVLAALLLIAVMVPILAPDNVRKRVSGTFSRPQHVAEFKVLGVTVDESTTERVKSWQEVLKDWTHRPLLGAGVTGYAWADAQYVKILGETGLAGLVAFFFVIYRLWVKARESFLRETDPFCKGLAHGFLLGLAAMLVHALGANTFIIVRIMEPFWLCAGLIMLLPTLQDRIGGKANEQAAA